MCHIVGPARQYVTPSLKVGETPMWCFGAMVPYAHPAETRGFVGAYEREEGPLAEAAMV